MLTPDTQPDDTEELALARCYALLRKRAAERRQALADFSPADILAELAERGAVGSFAHLADLLADARDKAMAATDTELRRRHTAIFWTLHGELRRQAGQ